MSRRFDIKLKGIRAQQTETWGQRQKSAPAMDGFSETTGSPVFRHASRFHGRPTKITATVLD
jgi:hypothetical protein